MRLLLVLALLVPSVAAAEAHPDCALSPELFDRLPELRTAKGERDANLELHNPWGEPTNLLTSKHFALKWGSQRPVDEATAQALLDRFENARDVEVAGWFLEDPTGIDGTFFNVYIGDTGPEVPSASGAGGYYSMDDWGYGFIVLGEAVLDNEEWADTVVAHEFFHAVQGQTGAYWDWDTGGWYWEATASWAAGQVYPDGYSWAQLLAPYAFSPHFSVSTWANDGSPEPPNLHQYGAFIFGEYITEFIDPVAVARSWGIAGDEDDPLEVLDSILTEHDLADVFADHAAHNVVWDYPRGWLFEQILEQSLDWLGAWDNRVVPLEPDDEGWISAPWNVEPQRYGSNAWPVPQGLLDGFDWRFQPEGDERWELRLVAMDGGTARYEDLEYEQPIEPNADQAWIVVTPVPEEWTGETRFGWSAQVAAFDEPDPDPTPEPTPEPTPWDPVDDDDSVIDEPRGLSSGGNACACSSSAGGSGLVALLLLGVRRRR